MSGLGTVEFAEAVDLGTVEFAQARNLGTLAEFAGAVDLGTVQTDLEDVPAAADYFATVQSTLGAANIVAHYKLDETTGTVAADATGNGYDGTYTNGPTLGATSLLTQGGGTSVDFDGVNDYVDVGVEPDFDFIHQTGVFTIGFWCDFTRSGTQNVFANSITNLSDGFFFRFLNTGALEFGINGAATYENAQTGAVSDGVHFVLATGDATTAKIYVDGTEQAELIFSKGGVANVRGTVIGAANVGPVGFFNGRIDEVFIANVTATPAQVSALYAYGTA